MTPQERAAALLDRIVGIIPMQPFQREARIEWLVEYAQETRRAALLEAAQVVREFVQHYPTDIFIEPLPGQHGRTVDACSASAIRAICPVIADALDRLREGVEG